MKPEDSSILLLSRRFQLPARLFLLIILLLYLLEKEKVQVSAELYSSFRSKQHGFCLVLLLCTTMSVKEANAEVGFEKKTPTIPFDLQQIKPEIFSAAGN